MQTTTNYGLKKPDPNDAYNKQNDNDNMDAIDLQMKANADASAAAQAKADAVQTTANAAETPAGAQAKVDAHIATADPHPQYILPSEGLSFVNLLPDSGRFMGKYQDPFLLRSTEPFTASDFFNPYNGGSGFVSAGKFIHDNSSFGGAGAALTQDMIDLLTAMGDIGGRASVNSKRYGVEFYIGETTMGSGTQAQGAGTDGYLVTVNDSKFLGGAAGYITFSFWLRIKSGGTLQFTQMNRLLKNGVEQQGVLTLTPADGWVHIEQSQRAWTGYSNGLPAMYANAGDVIQIALPVIVPGAFGVGIHTSPIPHTSLGYTPWHAGNDGVGSGLDADLLDGEHASAFSKLKFAKGSYVGDSTLSRAIHVGFAPQRVFVFSGSSSNASVYIPSTTGGSVFSTGSEFSMIGVNNTYAGKLTATGFITGDNINYFGNKSGVTYQWEAIG